jgi:hypothetical protein
MKVLASAVLTMESLVMGFALLLASKDHSNAALMAGGAIAILFLLCVGLLRTRIGWVLGSALQIALIGFGVVVTPLYFLGALFGGLWIAAIIVGGKGEAARAAFGTDETQNEGKAQGR